MLVFGTSFVAPTKEVFEYNFAELDNGVGDVFLLDDNIGRQLTKSVRRIVDLWKVQTPAMATIKQWFSTYGTR